MGSLQAFEFASAVENEEIDLDTALTWHLRSNHFPPLPVELVEAAKEAIANANNDDWDEPVDLRGVAIYKVTDKFAPTWACVEAWHLDAFLDHEEVFDG